jgi:hypothetical protein
MYFILFQKPEKRPSAQKILEMPLFKKVISSIPNTYNIPPIPPILLKPPPSSSTQNDPKPNPELIPPPNSLVCCNCKNLISEDSSQIKCEVGHVYCENCFDVVIDSAIKYEKSIVACSVKNCGKFFSAETVKDNVKGTTFKILSSFNQSVPQTTAFIMYSFFILYYFV